MRALRKRAESNENSPKKKIDLINKKKKKKKKKTRFKKCQKEDVVKDKEMMMKRK
jgi:hypothetical protein